jgi:adenosylhomocysteine nucleosidase
MSRVAIIAAMPAELKPLVRGWKHERREIPNAGAVHVWRHENGEWIAACAGAGQQAATRAFAEAEKDGPLTSAISIGWVGALSAIYAPGRAYRVSGVIDSLTGERFVVQERELGLQAHPSDKNKDVARVGHPELWLVTSPIVADGAEKQRLASAYKAALVDMEAAAVARLADMRGIPFSCYKGVSDGFSEDLLDFNRFISRDGQFQMGRLLLYVLPRPWHWPALIRMGENGRKASQSIRELLLENMDKPGVIANQNGNSNLTR